MSDMENFENGVSAALFDASARLAEQRREQTRDAIVSTMALIDTEIAEHNNIYPQNGGKLNQRELCRRAGVHYQTLQQPAHKATTLVEVKKWLDSKEVRTIREAKTAATNMADYWKEQHAILATKMGIYELELNERDVALSKARKDFETDRTDLQKTIDRLQKENHELRRAVADLHKGPNVTPLTRKTRKGD